MEIKQDGVIGLSRWSGFGCQCHCGDQTGCITGADCESTS